MLIWVILIFFDVAGTDGVFRQTPLHLAVGEGNVAAIGAILETSKTASKVKPNLNLKNSSGQTVLALALGNEMEDIAAELLKGLSLIFISDCSCHCH